MSALERVQSGLDGLSVSQREVADGEACFEVTRESLHEVVARLRDQLGFETNSFITAVDNAPDEPRFELTYQFLSIQHNDRVRLKLAVGESECSVPTITDLYPGTQYSEREVYDFFGIEFEGHEDLKRLHMPEAYDHFPLRKDFPHRGIEPDRLYREWERQHAGGNTYRS